jgi:hypothetical protein
MRPSLGLPARSQPGRGTSATRNLERTEPRPHLRRRRHIHGPLTVTGTGADGTDNITRPVEVTGGVGTGFESVTLGLVPSFTPVRTVNFTTKAQLDAAIAGMQAGDLIQYAGTGVAHHQLQQHKRRTSSTTNARAGRS